jgi:hypothetical protein
MEVLLNGTRIPVAVFVELVLHRTKIICSLLKMKGPILDAGDRQTLLGRSVNNIGLNGFAH